MRTKNITIYCVTNKLDDAMLEKHNIILSHDTAVLSAVKDAKATRTQSPLCSNEKEEDKFWQGYRKLV